MDAPVPFSNFNFLKPLNPELFTKIQSAESKARTDCRNCAQLTRQALETFINCVLRAKGLQVLLSESLDEKVKRLKERMEAPERKTLRGAPLFRTLQEQLEQLLGRGKDAVSRRGENA